MRSIEVAQSRCSSARGQAVAFPGRSDLKPDAERDFPGLVPNQLKHCPKDQNAKAREAISALTAQVAELREDNKKLLDQLVAAGFRNDELAQVLQADQAVTPERLAPTHR